MKLLVDVLSEADAVTPVLPTPLPWSPSQVYPSLPPLHPALVKCRLVAGCCSFLEVLLVQ